MVTSEDQEILLGEKAWKQIKEDNKISENEAYNKTLQKVAKNITENIKDKNYKWEFVVIESPESNAYCLPGGKVAVYSGFFDFLNNEGELAAIVGHEIAHALARHSGERLSQQYAAQIGGEALSQVLSQQKVHLATKY